MQIKATQADMKSFTTQQLLDHVIAVDAKLEKAPNFIQRTNYARWISNKQAIVREIAKRDGK